MFDSRLTQLVNAGYSHRQAERYGEMLPDDVVDLIGAAQTPQVAVEVMQAGLATVKASGEDIGDVECSGDEN